MYVRKYFLSIIVLAITFFNISCKNEEDVFFKVPHAAKGADADLIIEGGLFHFDFGKISLHYPARREIIIKNQGEYQAKIHHISTSSNFTFFSNKTWPGLGGTCSLTIRPGERCKIVIQFLPLAVKDYAEKISINYYSGYEEKNLNITMNGIGDATPRIYFNLYAPLDFGEHLYNTRSASKEVELIYAGAKDRSISNIYPNSTISDSFFIEQNNCSGNLDFTNNKCSITLYFHPHKTGNNISYKEFFVVNYSNGEKVDSSEIELRGLSSLEKTPAILTIRHEDNNTSGTFNKNGLIYPHTYIDKKIILTKQSGNQYPSLFSVEPFNDSIAFQVIPESTCFSVGIDKNNNSCYFLVRFSPYKENLTGRENYEETFSVSFHDGVNSTRPILSHPLVGSTGIAPEIIIENISAETDFGIINTGDQKSITYTLKLNEVSNFMVPAKFDSGSFKIFNKEMQVFSPSSPFQVTKYNCGILRWNTDKCTVTLTFKPLKEQYSEISLNNETMTSRKLTGFWKTIYQDYLNQNQDSAIIQPIKGLGNPRVKIVGGNIDFGSHIVGKNPVPIKTINLKHFGEESATNVSLNFNQNLLGSIFNYPGDNFPGTEGTCSNSISSSCTVRINFSPSDKPEDIKLFTDQFKIKYHNGLKTDKEICEEMYFDLGIEKDNCNNATNILPNELLASENKETSNYTIKGRGIWEAKLSISSNEMEERFKIGTSNQVGIATISNIKNSGNNQYYFGKISSISFQETDALGNLINSNKYYSNFSGCSVNTQINNGGNCRIFANYFPLGTEVRLIKISVTYKNGIEEKNLSLTFGETHQPKNFFQSYLSINKELLTFPETELSKSSSTQKITLSNTGNAKAINIDFSKLSDLTDGINLISIDCSTSLEAGDSCDLNFNFSPQFAGSTGEISSYIQYERPPEQTEEGLISEIVAVNLKFEGKGIVLPSLSVGSHHNCLIDQYGDLSCWGKNTKGQLGVLNTEKSFIRKAPTVFNSHNLLTSKEFFIDIATGENHTCTITSSKNVYCWGDNSKGQLGTGDLISIGDSSSHPLISNINFQNSIPVKLFLGGDTSCLKSISPTSQDEFYCWGNWGKNEFKKLPTKLTFGNQIIKASFSSHHGCFILESGKAHCWGSNGLGQLGLENNLEKTLENASESVLISESIKDISVGGAHTCVTTSPGKLKCFGKTESGALGTCWAVSSNGQGYSPCWQSTFGPLEGYGDKESQIESFLPIVSLGTSYTVDEIKSGNLTNCAIINSSESGDRSLKCWGKNEFGQLLRGDSADIGDESGEMGNNLFSIFTESGSEQILSFGVGYGHVCILTTLNKVSCWGMNFEGEIGGNSSIITFGDKADETDIEFAPHFNF